MYNLAFFGALAGIVVLLAVAALSNRITKGKFRLEVGGDYDERQQAARGVAYRNAFWAVVGYLALLQLLDIWNPPLYVLSFVGLFLALAVFLVSCIVLDAYIGLNDDPKKWVISSAVLLVIQLVGIAAYAPDFDEAAANVFTAALLAVVLVAFGVRTLLHRGQTEDEE
ncbi:MAG: hypothetical protein LUD78_00065 [Clostridiales bacterium]|nr:hypothetical protein [Clostridiales bacterium]